MSTPLKLKTTAGVLAFFISILTAQAQVQVWGVTQSDGEDQLGTVFGVFDDGSDFTVKSEFINSQEGTAPRAQLIEDANGILYGITSAGGENNGGTIFKIENGAFEKLSDLSPSLHGTNASSTLIIDDNGDLITTTATGGPSGGGCLIRYAQSGSIEVLHAFNSNTNGSNPRGQLFLNSSTGVIYGACSNGGNNGNGTVFRYTISNDSFAILHHFSGGNGGQYPQGGVILASDGLLYGTTQFGGTLSQGTIFSLNPANNAYAVIYNLNNTTSDGRYPFGALVESSPGVLMGTCSEGGSSGTGTVFKCTTAGTYTRLKSLSSAIDGGFTKTGLTSNGSGLFFGVTEFGAANGFGSVFTITEAGAFTKIHDFQYSETGANPTAPLYLRNGGSFAGVATSGGANNFGTVFTVNGNSVAKIHDFSLPLEGANPAGLIAGDQIFYGLTGNGGEFNTGVFFSIALDGSRETLYNFNGNIDGQNPNGKLAPASDGLFYGTARFGGSGLSGTVFSLSPAGDFELHHSFSEDGSQGQFPYAGVCAHSNGNLYGTTLGGGAFGDGVIFRLTSDGTYTVIYELFSFFDGAGCEATLVEGTDGKLYGVAATGGNFNGGTLFEFDLTSNVLTVLYHFDAGLDGAAPKGGLLLHSDGNFYGTTSEGLNGGGSLFRYNTSTGFELLHALEPATDGSGMDSQLTEDEEGFVYGFTPMGGGQGGGTAFRYSTDTGFELIHSFASGATPAGSPALFFPECYEDGDCTSSDPCAVAICNFGICEEIAINPEFTAEEIGFCEVGLDVFAMTIEVNLEYNPGGTLQVGGQEFDLSNGENSFLIELTGLPSDGEEIDLDYNFTSTGCSGTTGSLGMAPDPCPPIEITFIVDVDDLEVSPQGIHLGGNFQEWMPSEIPLTETSEGIWETTVSIGSGEFEFNFFNGTSIFDGEYVVGSCAVNGKRQLVVGNESETLNFCWSLCSSTCSTVGTNEGEEISFDIQPNLLRNGDLLQVNLPIEFNGTYDIIDMQGRIVNSGIAENQTRFTEEINGFASGMYTLLLRSNQEGWRPTAKKFVVE